MKRVFVNGYGSIGSRIASFLMDDPQVQVIGIGKHSPDAGVDTALSRGLDVFVPKDAVERFAKYSITGTIEAALDGCDLVIDASPGGAGFKNKTELYEPRGVMSIYQGGETVRGDQAVSNTLFNSRSNYDIVTGKTHVMQGSCNVTGMGRVIEPLRGAYPGKIARFDVTLIRRWADVEQTSKRVPDTIQMSEDPHHGSDAKEYLGDDAPLFVQAVKVPTRQMHMHVMDIRFKGDAPDPAEIHGIFTSEFGVATLWTAKDTKEIRDYAGTMGFSFTDTNMIHIHANMTRTIGDTVHMMYSDDQTGIVIPENHMLMQAMLFNRPYAEARAHTDSVFHMGEKKQGLESHFAKP